MRSVVITRSSGPEVLEPQDVEDPPPLGKARSSSRLPARASTAPRRSSATAATTRHPPPAGPSPYSGLECSAPSSRSAPTCPRDGPYSGHAARQPAS